MSEIIYKGSRKKNLEFQYNSGDSVEFPELAKRRAEANRKLRST